MEKVYEKDTAGATYRSRDPIKNLKIRVKLERLSATTIGFLKSPSAANIAESDVGTETSPSKTNQFGQSILESEELVVQWKQKLFSQREMDFYGFEPNCTTVQDYKYHAEVDKIKKSGGRRNNRRLFTYLDGDRFAMFEDVFTPSTTSPDEGVSRLATKMDGIRRRKPAESSPAWKINQGKSISGIELVVDDPTQEFKDKHHVVDTPVHTLIIMADLSPESQMGSVEFERRLFTIEYDDNCVMRVTPDFSHNKNKNYRVDDIGLNRDVWEYRIEHLSNAVSKLEAQREAKLLAEMYRKHQRYLQKLVGDEFESIPEDMLRLVVHGEVVSAQSFEFDYLHVEFFCDVPENWSGDVSQLMSGCTQTCKTAAGKDGVRRANFCLPFNFQLFLDLTFDRKFEEANTRWPKIFVHVISSDGWGRRRSEGYSYVTLPTDPGRRTVTAQCWRPVGNGAYPSIVAEMRRFFIGASPELEDATYVHIPHTFNGKRLSRYGTRAESTGSVTLALNCVQQCNSFLDHSSQLASKKRVQKELKKAKMLAKADITHSVLDAYQRARKRMQLARESVPMQLTDLINRKSTAANPSVESLRSRNTTAANPSVESLRSRNTTAANSAVETLRSRRTFADS